MVLDDATGYVGIGTTSPSEKLEVNGNIKAIGNINASSLNAQNGFSGDCVNTTYSGGIAISCND